MDSFAHTIHQHGVERTWDGWILPAEDLQGELEMFPGKLRWRCWQLLQECLRLYLVELLETSFDALVARIDVVIAEHHSFGPMLRNERSCRYRSARVLGRQNASHLVQVNTEDLQQYNYIAVTPLGYADRTVCRM